MSTFMGLVGRQYRRVIPLSDILTVEQQSGSDIEITTPKYTYYKILSIEHLEAKDIPAFMNPPKTPSA